MLYTSPFLGAEPFFRYPGLWNHIVHGQVNDQTKIFLPENWKFSYFSKITYVVEYSLIFFFLYI